MALTKKKKKKSGLDVLFQFRWWWSRMVDLKVMLKEMFGCYVRQDSLSILAFFVDLQLQRPSNESLIIQLSEFWFKGQKQSKEEVAQVACFLFKLCVLNYRQWYVKSIKYCLLSHNTRYRDCARSSWLVSVTWMFLLVWTARVLLLAK